MRKVYDVIGKDGDFEVVITSNTLGMAKFRAEEIIKRAESNGIIFDDNFRIFVRDRETGKNIK